MPMLLGLAAAVTWGAADFCGGLAARRAAPSRVVLLAHGTSLVLLLAWSLRQPAHLSGWATVSGVLSGIAGGVALMLFYEALALGAMGLSAAVAGLLTAVLPVLLALRTQGAPGAPQLAGFAVAAASIVLIAYAPQPAPVLAPSAGEASAAGSGDDTLRMVDDGSPDAAKSRRAASSRKPLVFAVLAGLGFGLQLVWLHTSASAGSSEDVPVLDAADVLRARAAHLGSLTGLCRRSHLALRSELRLPSRPQLCRKLCRKARPGPRLQCLPCWQACSIPAATACTCSRRSADASMSPQCCPRCTRAQPLCSQRSSCASAPRSCKRWGCCVRWWQWC